MAKPKMQYVHVVEFDSGASVKVVGPTDRAEKVSSGMDINLDHDKCYTVISECPHLTEDRRLCLLCAR